MGNNDLISLGSPSEAAQHIRRLLSNVNNLSESKKLEEELRTLADGLITPSPADVERIFSVDLNFEDLDEIEMQEDFVKDFFNDGEVLRGFIWVEISGDGKVVVVGKSGDYGKSDLFSKYLLLSGNTTKALIARVSSHEDQLAIQRCEDQINQSIAGAVIIPLRWVEVNNSNKYLTEAETLIGEQIIRAYGAINPSSHTK